MGTQKPARRKSTLSILDDGLMVVAAVIGALLVLKFVGVIGWLIWSLIKLAAVAGFIYVVLRGLRNRGR